MEALRGAFQHLYDDTNSTASPAWTTLGDFGPQEWQRTREEAESLVRAVLQTNALIEVVVELQIVKICNAEGLDPSKIIPPGSSTTQARANGRRLAVRIEHDPRHAFSFVDYDDGHRLSELRDVYLQALNIMRFLVLLNAKTGCQLRGLNPRAVLGSGYGFSDLDDVLNSFSHTLFRIPLTANAMQALRAYPISMAKQLLRDIQAVKRGSFLPLVFSILVVGGSRKTKAGHELGKSARAFVGYLVRQDGVSLHLADPTLRQDQILGAAKFDQAQWDKEELAKFDAVVLLSRPAKLDLSILDDVDVCILEELD